MSHFFIMNKINQAKHPVLKFNRNDYYPYVQLPRAIELHLSGPVLPPKPKNITEPILPQKPNEPSLPKVPKKVMEKLEAALSTGAGTIALYTMIITELPWFLIIAGMAGVTALAKFTYDSFEYEKRMDDYKKNKLPKYEKESAEYPMKLRAWEKLCHKLNAEHQQRKQEAELEYGKQIEVITKAWKEGKTSFPGKLDYHPLNEYSNSKKGRNDDLLRARLENRISLVQGLEIELLSANKGLSIPGFDFPYTPDIAMQVKNKDKTLFLDIENDEPWYAENGEKYIIHEVENKNHEKRDVFFVERDWIVIRFSEQQIVKETDKCVDFILDIVKNIFQPGYSNIRLPKEHKRWTLGNALDIQRIEASVDNKTKDFVNKQSKEEKSFNLKDKTIPIISVEDYMDAEKLFSGWCTNCKRFIEENCIHSKTTGLETNFRSEEECPVCRKNTLYGATISLRKNLISVPDL
jgi:hypothetical protein